MQNKSGANLQSNFCLKMTTHGLTSIFSSIVGDSVQQAASSMVERRGADNKKTLQTKMQETNCKKTQHKCCPEADIPFNTNRKQNKPSNPPLSRTPDTNCTWKNNKLDMQPINTTAGQKPMGDVGTQTDCTCCTVCNLHRRSTEAICRHARDSVW